MLLAASPIGPLSLVADDGALTGLFIDERADGHASTDPVLLAAAEQMAAYFAGDLKEFDLPLAPRGTPFQQQVWAELLRVPFGATATYGEIAARIGRPTACRAVGAANGRNPISIVIPCHRLVGHDGNLVKYGGGLDRKRFLLDHESGVRSGRRLG